MKKSTLSSRRELCGRNDCAKIVSLWIDWRIIRLNQDTQRLLSRYSRSRAAGTEKELSFEDREYGNRRRKMVVDCGERLLVAFWPLQRTEYLPVA